MAALGRNRLDGLVDRAKELGAKGLAWFKVTSDAPAALTSPLDKVLSDAERAGLVAATGAGAGDLVLVVADEWRTACERARASCGSTSVGPRWAEGERRFFWVTDFPLFDGTDDEGNPQAAHHPFTMPHPDDLDLLGVRSRPGCGPRPTTWSSTAGSSGRDRSVSTARTSSAGSSTRSGIPPEEAEARFGFLLGAFRYGAPPHGGFAVGVDRFVAVLAGEDEPP